MLYREIIAVCSQIHTKHINTLHGQNVELLNVKLAVQIVTNEGQSDDKKIHTPLPEARNRALSSLNHAK